MENKFALIQAEKSILRLIDDEESFSKNSNWPYANRYYGFAEELNQIIKQAQVNNIQSIGGEPFFEFNSFDLSSSEKTLTPSGVERFKKVLNRLYQEIKDEKNINTEQPTPNHQMRRCFKTGADRCPLNPNLDDNQIFIGTPFHPKYKDSYEYGIKIAVEQNGFRTWRADEDLSNIDIMCKICFELQRSRLAVFNLSGHNANVMMELGLALGMGKETLILLDSETQEISDLKGLEYIRYSHAYELQQKLSAYLLKIA